MAALHAACFNRPPPWDATAIAAVLDTRGSFVLDRPQGFLIGRVIADEAELLTLAVDPPARRQGVARALCDEFARHAAKQGAVTAFLEVASDNLPAQALYAGLGWQGCGRRRDYYAPGVDALVLRRVLHKVAKLSQESG